MADSPVNDIEFTLLSVALRAELTDDSQLLDHLATLFEAPLAEHCSVRRSVGSLLVKKKVEAVLVRMGKLHFVIRRDGSGKVVTQKNTVENDKVLKTEDIASVMWIDELACELSKLAKKDEKVALALANMIPKQEDVKPLPMLPIDKHEDK